MGPLSLVNEKSFAQKKKDKSAGKAAEKEIKE